MGPRRPADGVSAPGAGSSDQSPARPEGRIGSRAVQASPPDAHRSQAELDSVSVLMNRDDAELAIY